MLDLVEYLSVSRKIYGFVLTFHEFFRGMLIGTKIHLRRREYTSFYAPLKLDIVVLLNFLIMLLLAVLHLATLFLDALLLSSYCVPYSCALFSYTFFRCVPLNFLLCFFRWCSI